MSTQTEQPQRDLRARRRLQTRAEVSSIAIDLFHRQGLAHTTVDDIANAAGISARTFFRYFHTKEAAALLGHEMYGQAIDDLAFAPKDPRGALDRIEQLYQSLFEGVDDKPGEQLVLQRLIHREPSLRLAAAAQYATTSEHLVQRLVAALGEDRYMTARLIVEVSSATANAALEQWAKQDGQQTLVCLHRDAMSALWNLAAPSTALS